MRILAVLNSSKTYPPARLKDISHLNLPSQMEGELHTIIHTDRMMWEPWIESAENYEALYKSLRKRHFKRLPSNGVPQVMMADDMVKQELKPKRDTKVTRTPARKTMLRRN